MSSEKNYQKNSEIADARLGVAEELGWPLATLAASCAYLMWDGWILALTIAFGSYVLVTLKYRRDAKKAEDEYFRDAGLGKYAAQKPSNET